MKKIIQITSGKGPEECAWVVARVLSILLDEARAKGITYGMLDQEKGAHERTLYSATVQLEGEEKRLNDFLASWKGCILWIGQSAVRKKHKRKNWFVGINEMDLSSEIFSVTDPDFRFEAMRSSGPGGQHVNKVSTAVRATHLPTGLSATASDSRSQLQNKKKAKERLILLLEQKQVEQQKKKIQAGWGNHQSLERGNPVRVFTGTNFKPQKTEKNYKSKRQSLKNDLRNKMDE